MERLGCICLKESSNEEWKGWDVLKGKFNEIWKGWDALEEIQ